MTITRRKFIKRAVLMGTAVSAFPMLFAENSSGGNIPKTIVHPDVDNLRVVGITDPGMTRGHEPVCNWARQNELVVTNSVEENMDKLAMGLTQTENTEQAWRTIFLKPPGKSWSETVVAIKTNNIAQQHTRSHEQQSQQSTHNGFPPWVMHR